jgi:hypothetical protein
MLYNFSERTPPASTLTPADALSVKTAIREYGSKRRFMETMDSKASKKSKDDDKGGTRLHGSTNFGPGIINALLNFGYDVEMPPDPDDVNVLIPLSWVRVIY